MTTQGSWDEAREIFSPPSYAIFVFGSNLAGRHGRGAALYARQHFGAQYGTGEGRTGRSYAIPTKGYNIYSSLPLAAISNHVWNFITHATNSLEDVFFLTRIGCGLAGYKDYQIAPMFAGVPDNIIVPLEWQPFIGSTGATEEYECSLKKNRIV